MIRFDGRIVAMANSMAIPWVECRVVAMAYFNTVPRIDGRVVAMNYARQFLGLIVEQFMGLILGQAHRDQWWNSC